MNTATCKKLIPMATMFAAIILLFAPASLPAQQGGQVGQVHPGDYFAARGAGDVERLRQEYSDFRSKIEEGKLGSYPFWHLEAEFRLALDSLLPLSMEEQDSEYLKMLSLQLYGRLIEAFYSSDETPVNSAAVQTQLEFFLMDIVLASALISNADSYAPMIRRLLARAEYLELFADETHFLNSVREMLEIEYPNWRGAANLIAAEWITQTPTMAGQDSLAKEPYREACIEYAERAADALTTNDARAIAYFLLAKQNERVGKDRSWKEYQRCIDISTDSLHAQAVYYGKDYHRETYVREAINFLYSYFEHLYNQGRYFEICSASDYLLGCRASDAPLIARIKDRTIYWTEKSILKLRDADRQEEAEELYNRLQKFYEL